MIKTDIKFNVSIPNFDFKKDLKVIADNIVIPELSLGINNQVDINGTTLPALEHSTLKIKAKKGQSLKTLIAEGKLFRSFISRETNNGALVTINEERKDIGGYLQNDGVGKKKKKFKFFGVTKGMEDASIRYIKKRIKEILNAKR